MTITHLVLMNFLPGAGAVSTVGLCVVATDALLFGAAATDTLTYSVLSTDEGCDA